MSETNRTQTNQTSVKGYTTKSGKKVGDYKRKAPQSGPRLGVDPEEAVAAAYNMSKEQFSEHRQSLPKSTNKAIESTIKHVTREQAREAKRTERRNKRYEKNDLKYATKYGVTLEDARMVREKPQLHDLVRSGYRLHQFYQDRHPFDPEELPAKRRDGTPLRAHDRKSPKKAP